MTAKEFLDQQDDLARRRLGHSAKAIGQELHDVVNVNELIRQRPYVSLGVGVGSGLLVGNRLAAALRSGREPGWAGRIAGFVTRPILFALRSAILAAVFAEAADGEAEA